MLMVAPTASMKEADLQMQVKSVRVQEVEAMPSVADFWAHSGSLERSGREAWSCARVVDVRVRRVRRVRESIVGYGLGGGRGRLNECGRSEAMW